MYIVSVLMAIMTYKSTFIENRYLKRFMFSFGLTLYYI